MNVIVYVEGPSDRNAMQALLKPLLERKRQSGVEIRFSPSPKGDKKETVLTKVPRMAVDIIVNDPTSVVVAMPDLYPKNKSFPHETEHELKAGVWGRFESALRSKNAADDDRLKQRFHVFCFKYDLEALVLAAEEELKQHLGASKLTKTWCEPVEDQDHGKPPKRIVEDLFRSHDKLYKGAVDAPAVLGRADYEEIAAKCPQCFKPFVEFLESCTAQAH